MFGILCEQVRLTSSDMPMGTQWHYPPLPPFPLPFLSFLPALPFPSLPLLSLELGSSKTPIELRAYGVWGRAATCHTLHCSTFFVTDMAQIWFHFTRIQFIRRSNESHRSCLANLEFSMHAWLSNRCCYCAAMPMQLGVTENDSSLENYNNEPFTRSQGLYETPGEAWRFCKSCLFQCFFLVEVTIIKLPSTGGQFDELYVGFCGSPLPRVYGFIDSCSCLLHGVNK